MGEQNKAISVAVLDSSPLARHALSSMLKEAGIQQLGAWAGVSEASTLLETSPPTVTLVGVAGAATEELGFIQTSLRRDPALRFLALGDGDAAGDLPARSWQAGALGYLQKDTLTGSSLASAVRAVADGMRVLPASYGLGQLNAHRRTVAPALGKLSEREREVLVFISGGADNLKIAALLGIAERTVKAHVSSLYRKLGIENRSQLVIFARDSGLHLDDSPR